MDKKPLIVVSLCVVVLLVLCSLSNVVGMNNGKTAIPDKTMVNNNQEIITFISGSAYSGNIIKNGFIRNVEIFAGEGGTLMEIHGWRLHPFGRFHEINVQYIHASHFIGIFIGSPYGPVRGIAIGNVEWS